MLPDDAERLAVDRAGVWDWVRRLARRALGRPQPAHAVRRHPFDQVYGVDTSGLIEQRRLRTGHAHDGFNTAYFGVPPSRFANAVERWRRTPGTLPIEAYRLIDVGCGKGRAVLLASSMQFSAVIGVELHPGLAGTAQENLTRWREQGRVVAEASVVCGDGPALVPTLLRGPTLVYLYNPFRAPVLRALLAGLVAQRDELSAPVDVLYLYPEHEEVFGEFAEFERLWREEIFLSPEDENDGISAASDPCSLYRLDAKQG